MDIFIVTIEALSVLLGISIIGFYLTRRGLLTENSFKMLSHLALEVALPCLVFHTIITKFKPNETPDWWMIPLWWLLFTITALGLSLLGGLAAKKKNRREFTVSLFYQNAIFIPLVILTGMDTSDNSLYIVTLFIFTMFYGAFFFNTYHLFIRSEKKKINIKKILHPVLVSTLIAISIRLLDIQLYIPGFATKLIEILGNISLPLIMILLGGYIAIDIKDKKGIDLLEVTKFIVIKNIIFPLTILLFLLIIKPPYHIALVFFLQSAIPPVTAIPIVVEREGGDRNIANQFLVGSFISSLVSLPLMITLFITIY